MHEPRSGPRWHLWLPLVAAAAAAAMIGLAAVAARSLAERDELALEGRVMVVAHDVERELRDEGLDAAPEVLASQLSKAGSAVSGLVLRDLNEREVAAAGSPAAGAPRRHVPVFLGPQAGRRLGGGPFPGGHGRGRLLLTIILAPATAQPPLVARLILPATILFALALITLAALVGRLLVRQRQRSRREAEQRRLEALGRAGAGLAHQLRTPLATIKGSCQLLAEDLPAGPTANRLAAAVAAATRMERLLASLLEYARPPAPEPVPVLLAGFLEEVAGAAASVRSEPGAVALADPEHLRQILENLVANAAAAAPGEPVEISARTGIGVTEVVVADRGPGPGDDPEELFEPYVTGRADGTGLGLPIARTLAEANGGTLQLRPRAGGGCAAVLVLPATHTAEGSER